MTLDFLYSILSFVVAIGVLVTVHEFGHFWVARRLGVKVLRFSIGFGRALWRRVGTDGTEYVVAAIPLGGYVKMLDEREAEVPEAELPGAFNRKPLWVRFAVVFAGPAFNFIFAVFAYWLMFVIGVSGLRPLVGAVSPDSLASAAGLASDDEIVAVDDNPTRSWETVMQALLAKSLRGGVPVKLDVKRPGGDSEQLTLNLSGVRLDDLTRGEFLENLGLAVQRPEFPSVIGSVTDDGAARRDGLRPGDRVLSADGNTIADWQAWVEYVRARPEQPMNLSIDRDGTRMELRLRPKARSPSGGEGWASKVAAYFGFEPEQAPEEPAYGFIGAGPEPLAADAAARYRVIERYGAGASLGRAVAKTYDVSALTLRMFWKMLTLEVSVKNISGPISIAQYAGYSAQLGVERFLQFLAIVSISLGILNLLPIPVLDGGHLMYYFMELIKGSPVSEGAQLAGQRVGIAMLVGLMSLAFYNDLARLFG